MNKATSIELKPYTNKSNLFAKANGELENLIGYLRLDFGRSGEEFWSAWFPSNDALNTETFKHAFDDFINVLRKKDNLLSSYSSMCKVVYNTPEAKLEGEWAPMGGFTATYEGYIFFIRAILHKGDYNAYVYAYAPNNKN